MAGESATETLPAVVAGAGEQLPATNEALGGTRKAAVLMAALGSERAASVLQRLSEAEIEHLSIEMANLNSVAAETTESIFTEIAELATGELGASGGMEFARGVIERALGPERAAELLGRLSARTETPPSSSCSASRRIAPRRCCAASRHRRSH